MLLPFRQGSGSRERYGANKVAAENVLLDSGMAVSVLRPSRIHDIGGKRPREWVFVKRVLDGRRHLLLARGRRGTNHPTAAVNLAALVAFCAARPTARILNSADPVAPNGRTISRIIAAQLNHAWAEVPLDETAPEDLGDHPWNTLPSFFGYAREDAWLDERSDGQNLRTQHAAGDDEFPSRHQSPPSSASARWDAGRTKKTTMRGITVQPNEITEVLNRPISQELLARDLTRLAYVAKDGTPRNVPIAFTWNGSEIVMCTAKNAPKLPSLRENPTVALTMDTEVFPPQILLIRGRATLDVVDGIPDEYLEANGTYKMTPEQRTAWEAEVRSLYNGMVRIVVTPTWAKLIDFETTLPSAVEELVRQRDERQRA